MTWPLPSVQTGRPKGLLRGSSQHVVFVSSPLDLIVSVSHALLAFVGCASVDYPI